MELGLDRGHEHGGNRQEITFIKCLLQDPTFFRYAISHYPEESHGYYSPNFNGGKTEVPRY